MAETGVALYDRVVGTAMEFPWIKVDRDSFLRKEFRLYCSDRLDLIVADNPSMHVSMDLIDKIAKDVIQSERVKVSLISAATGLPSNPFAAAGLAVADMGQYTAICLKTCQELAYLYGFPDLVDENGEVSSGTVSILTPLVGIMFGVKLANEITAKLCQQIAIQAAKRLSIFALSRPGWYILAKQVAKFIGVRMSRQLALKGVTKIAPLIGSVVSGTLTYAAFGPGAERLRKQLRENSRFFKSDGYQIDTGNEEDLPDVLP